MVPLSPVGTLVHIGTSLYLWSLEENTFEHVLRATRLIIAAKIGLCLPVRRRRTVVHVDDVIRLGTTGVQRSMAPTGV